MEPSDLTSELNLFPNQSPPAISDKHDASSQRAFPDQLMEPLESALTEAEIWLTKNVTSEFGEDLLALFFRMHAFRRTAEVYDEHFVTIFESKPEI